MLFEFFIEGPPLSHQTQNRARLQAWKDAVRAAAAAWWPPSRRPLEGNLQFVVVYYHDGPAVRMDNDNLLKPIQDALNGMIYHDDRQIVA